MFYPAAQSVSVSGNNVTGQNFTAQLGYTVSGTFSYTGVLTRNTQVYLSLQNPNCSACAAPGTSVTFGPPGSGSFTIHGVTPGTYALQAW